MSSAEFPAASNACILAPYRSKAEQWVILSSFYIFTINYSLYELINILMILMIFNQFESGGKFFTEKEYFSHEFRYQSGAKLGPSGAKSGLIPI